MSIFRLSTCGVFWLILILFFSLSPARAEVSLVVTGISAISGNNISQAEKIAYDDAFYKAYLELALKQVSATSSVEIAQKLKGFVASRGTQDIIQYHIVSRSQQENVLVLSLDLKINDIPLKEWLQSQAFTTPLGLRPLILLAISTKGPGLSDRYEWWSTTTPKDYSVFENQLSLRLKTSGENVADVPKRITVLPAGPDRATTMAANLGASLVITGTIFYKTVDAANLETRVDISLIDVKSRLKVYIFTLSLKGTVDVRTMNELIMTAFFDQLKSAISKKVVVINPVLREKSLCIDGIRDYDSYQSIITSLRSIDSVTKIAISRIAGHSICHSIQIRGNLEDILDNLKQKQITQADMVVEKDAASIKIISP